MINLEDAYIVIGVIMKDALPERAEEEKEKSSHRLQEISKKVGFSAIGAMVLSSPFAVVYSDIIQENEKRERKRIHEQNQQG